MPTTTNYGWTTPADTDLVKDGASAIRTLGSSADTTVKNLNPETTLGDIAYRSSTSNVNTRLGIGSTGQVLTVASGVPSWATPAASSGKVLQVVSTQITSTVSVTTSATAFNYVDVTGFSVTITPTSATSKILFTANVSAGGSSDRLYYRIMRDSTEIGVGDAGTGQECSAGFYSSDGYSVLNNFMYWYDSPATTAATTYKIQVSANQPSLTSYFNRSSAGLVGDSAKSASQITVMEIGA